jgi:hypothetical protein
MSDKPVGAESGAQPKTEPFAELATILKRYTEEWAEMPVSVHLAEYIWQAALPTQEQYAQAARQIAEESDRGMYNSCSVRVVKARIEQILTSILGQPGGKK